MLDTIALEMIQTPQFFLTHWGLFCMLAAVATIWVINEGRRRRSLLYGVAHKVPGRTPVTVYAVGSQTLYFVSIFTLGMVAAVNIFN